VTESILEELNSFREFKLMSFVHIIKHIAIALDQYLRVMLPVKQLFITVSLNSLQQIIQLVLLHFL